MFSIFSDILKQRILQDAQQQQIFEMRADFVDNLQQFDILNLQQMQINPIGTLIGFFQVITKDTNTNLKQQEAAGEKKSFSHKELDQFFGLTESGSTSKNNPLLEDNFQENMHEMGDLDSPQVSKNIFFEPYSQQKEQNFQVVIKKKRKSGGRKDQKRKTIQQESINNKKKRKDGKEATQNAASKAFTLALSIIYKRLNNKAKKKEMKLQFLNFLNENNAKSSQTVLVFIYIYLKRLKIQPEQFYWIGSNLLLYLNQKIPKCDQEITLLRYDAYKEIIQSYYMEYDGKEVNLEWFIEIFKPLFHGKQKSRLHEPIEKLRKCLEKFDSSEIEKDNESNPHYKNIQ